MASANMKQRSVCVLKTPRMACGVLFFAIFVAPAMSRSLADESAERYRDIVLQDEPVAYWRFEEVGADMVANAVAWGDADAVVFDGHVEGPLQFDVPGPRPPELPLFETTNCAVEFSSGSTAWLRIADPGEASPLDFDQGDAITIEAWVSLEDARRSGYYYILGKGRTGRGGKQSENHNYALRLQGKGTQAVLSFLFRSAGDEGEWHRWTSSSGASVGDGWHHVAVTYEFGKPKSIRGYVDGEPVNGKWDMGGETDRPPVVDDDELWIGSSMGGNVGSTFVGRLDEVALYRTALPAERIATRYRFVTQPLPEIAWDELPESGVLVDVFERIEDKKTWNFRAPQHSDRYESPNFAFLGVPKKYSPRGVQVDRTNPFLLRASGKVVLPEGPLRLLVRCRNASRLYLDGEQIAETEFHSISGTAHGRVFPLDFSLAPNLRELHRGDTEAVIEIEGDGLPHQLTFEMIVGGQSHRPDFGETAVFFAPPGEDFRLFGSAPAGDSVNEVLLTNASWEPFQRRQRAWLTRLDTQRRAVLDADERAYWARRHDWARQAIGDRPQVPVPELPEGMPANNAIDHFLAEKLAAAGQEPLPLADDLAFLRRVALDTIGTIPTPEQIETYLAVPPGERRRRAVERFLQHDGWADHWVGYWQDVLAENPNIINPTLNNTGPFRWWIHESLLDNKPMDRFVTELVLQEGSSRFGGPAGFGVATQNDAPMAAKAHILGQAFLGVEMKCARCHDSPYHDYKQRDLFALAAMLKRGPQDVPASSSVPGGPDVLGSMLIEVTLEPGSKVPPEWPFDNLAREEHIPEHLLRDPSDSRERLAALIVSPFNERFAQVMVNRVWHRLFGVGLVEPVDDWHHPEPSHPELLDYLARQFFDSGYDLKHVARLILTSHAYGRKTIDRDHPAAGRPYLYAGPLRRRMAAEQVVDSLFVASGKPLNAGPMNVDIDGARALTASLDLGEPTRAWQFTSLSNERDRPSLALPFAEPFVAVLESFGWRSSRQDPLTVRNDETTPQQPAVLANGVVGLRTSQLSDDSAITELALTDQTLDALVDRLFLRLLTRLPSDSERAMFVELLAPGYENRVVEGAAPVQPKRRTPRNQVAWSNHLSEEANRIKTRLQQEVREGDPPTARLEEGWRTRMEDAVWVLVNSPEFIFVP